MSVLLITIIFLGLLGFIGAVVLYVTARKFHVEEDPRIDAICNELPGANCGGCGMKGCRDFATECVNRGSLAGLNCPVSGTEGMTRIATILGVESTAAERKIAVLRCNGNCTARPHIYRYDGEKTCAIMDAVGVGTSGCSYGCLGCGDCTTVCVFDAIHINNESGLPDVDSDKCTACGACVAECPRHILELRPTGPRDRRVWVACSSKDRGAEARKVCAAACIGCGKCARECPFGAINISDNLAYIMPDACKACGKCARVCPTGAILTSFTFAAAQS